MRRVRAARQITDFDSSVNMVRAIGSFLNGEDHPGLSVGPSSLRLGDIASSPPRTIRRLIFNTMGIMQGVPLDQVRNISVDDIDHWVTQQYGPGPYPVLVIGSASGAAVHLAAALRAPYLPQTTLVAVRDIETHPDEAIEAMEALAPTVRHVAELNPRVSVYHMHDPAQDRPMLQSMAYLRLKRLELGRAYQEFIEQRLAPGATIIQLECTRTWRSRQVAERGYFQFGCLGGVPEAEYHDTGRPIAEYLQVEASHRRDWQPPEMDARRPEAEWGWDPALGPDIEAVADRGGFDLRRLVVEEPQELSPFVADLHRWWYRQRGLPADRLLAECYVQWDPMWVLRLGAVPFWLRFNMEPSYEEFAAYLDGLAEPYHHIHLNLFSQGLSSPGLVSIEQWQELIGRNARTRGEIIGVDTDAYPVDTGATVRYQKAFESLPPRQPLPAPLPVSGIDRFVDQSGDAHPRVGWKSAVTA